MSGKHHKMVNRIAMGVHRPEDIERWDRLAAQHNKRTQPKPLKERKQGKRPKPIYLPPNHTMVGRNPDGTRRVWREGEPLIVQKPVRALKQKGLLKEAPIDIDKFPKGYIDNLVLTIEEMNK